MTILYSSGLLHMVRFDPLTVRYSDGYGLNSPLSYHNEMTQTANCIHNYQYMGSFTGEVWRLFERTNASVNCVMISRVMICGVFANKPLYGEISIKTQTCYELQL